MTDIIHDVLAMVIPIMGLAVAICNIIFLRRYHPPWGWVKMMYACIGIMYAVLYMIIMSGVQGVVMLWMRPAITITLGGMLAGAIVSLRSHGKL